MRASWVLGVSVALAAVPGSAMAQEAVPQTAITATGYGSAKPVPVDRNSEKSIAAAVERAEKAALPAAVEQARERAAQLARAAGLTLGRLISISDPPASPYGPFGYAPPGAFGPGQFCRTVGGIRVTRDRDGTVHRKRVKRHRVCRVPAHVQTTVLVTFDTVASAPAG